MTTHHLSVPLRTLILSLGLVTLTHCVTSDPVDQQGNEDNLRTVDDQGGVRGDDGSPGMEDLGTGQPEDMGTRDQGVITPDMNALDMANLDGGRKDDMPGGEEDMSIEEDMTAPSMDMETEDMAPDMSIPNKCRRAPELEDTRAIVAARPYLDDGSPGTSYEVFTLDLQGVVMSTGRDFDMGRAIDGKIHFTPDGEVGVVRQEDGSLGIFKLDANHNVTVIDPGYVGLQAKVNPSQARYFSTVTMLRDGSGLIATNGSWRNVGGSVWYIPLDCVTGLPGQEVQIAESKLARHVQQLHGNDGQLVVASHDILAPMVREDAHLLDIHAPTMPTLLGSARIFMDDDATMTAMAISENDKHVLLGDSNLFGGPTTNHRVGVFEITPNGLIARNIISDILDPADIVVSPHHNAAIVSSFEGNKLVVLDYEPNNVTTPFTPNGEVRTTNATLLPSTMVMVRRGALNGVVVVAENTGIRTLQFMPSGDVLELHQANFGQDLSDIIGAIGVQP